MATIQPSIHKDGSTCGLKESEEWKNIMTISSTHCLALTSVLDYIATGYKDHNQSHDRLQEVYNRYSN
jgi:hypothetical protein